MNQKMYDKVHNYEKKLNQTPNSLVEFKIYQKVLRNFSDPLNVKLLNHDMDGYRQQNNLKK